MTSIGKYLVFGSSALAMLAFGCVGAQFLWHATHHRYDQPNSGWYHGSVQAVFHGAEDDDYLFHFRGQTEPRWQWTWSTNFTYRTLQFESQRFDVQADQDKHAGTLQLPSFAYTTSMGTGVLTRAVLSEWLLGTTDGASTGTRSVERVFEMLEDAGCGTLPAPRHHGYVFDQPVRGSMRHFRNGVGVGGLVYIWIVIWFFAAAFLGRKFFQRSPDQRNHARARA